MQAGERARESRARRRSSTLSRVVAGALVLALAGLAYLTLGPDPVSYRFSPRAAAAGPLSVTVFGDSLAAGTCGDGHGYIELVAEALAKSRPGSVVTNMAVPGGRISTVRERLSALPSHDIGAVIVQVGANDVQHLTSPLDFARDFRTSLDRIHVLFPSAAVVVLGIPDIAERNRMVPSGLAPEYSTLTRYYDLIERRAAEQHGATFYDFFALSHDPAAVDAANVCYDAIHPNPAGYAILAAHLQPALRPVLRY